MYSPPSHLGHLGEQKAPLHQKQAFALTRFSGVLLHLINLKECYTKMRDRHRQQGNESSNLSGTTELRLRSNIMHVSQCTTALPGNSGLKLDSEGSDCDMWLAYRWAGNTSSLAKQRRKALLGN